MTNLDTALREVQIAKLAAQPVVIEHAIKNAIAALTTELHRMIKANGRCPNAPNGEHLFMPESSLDSPISASCSFCGWTKPQSRKVKHA